MEAGRSMSGIVLPKISEPPTSESLRLRVLAYMNGAPSSQELRKKAAVKRKAKA
jgi:hypothetical protein